MAPNKRIREKSAKSATEKKGKKRRATFFFLFSSCSPSVGPGRKIGQSNGTRTEIGRPTKFRVPYGNRSIETPPPPPSKKINSFFLFVIYEPLLDQLIRN